ncbi:hypothetical protein E1B28_003849 [Marasmius oreades]|uniref:Kinase-like protein n=1 Tax=Marasmius oreades TaxID=181124 RepID=A0A9P7UXJ8_9AGAR|nr:uncharacterized protein E1B28_003849 [Marasmius oreades]KAG7096408.1 hypothetical protein E1B28_003849 [Marasmius oreades]
MQIRLHCLSHFRMMNMMVVLVTDCRRPCHPFASQSLQPRYMSTSIQRESLSNGLQQELSALENIIEDETKRELLLQSRGDEAQFMLDLLQLLADLPGPTSPRSHILKIMSRLSKNSRRFPQCLVIRNIKLLGKHPFGCGAFGDVWRGIIGDSATGQIDCAVKIVRRAYFSQATAGQDDHNHGKVLNDHVREAIIWRQLKHPNVLPFLGIYYLDGNREDVCLVSPYMVNGNLAQFLRNTDPDKVVSHILISDIALGLEYLHDKDIVHGDLKELNILVTESYRACICDFGLSRLVVTLGLPPSTYRGGTLGYMAPEVLLGSSSSKPSDIYSYGSLCHRILIKVYDLPNNLVRGIGGDLAFHQRPTNLPKDEDHLWSLVQDCWKQEPSTRPTAGDIIRRVTTANETMTTPNWHESLHSIISNNVDLLSLIRVLESRSRSRRQITGVSTSIPLAPVSHFPQVTERGGLRLTTRGLRERHSESRRRTEGSLISDQVIQTLTLDIGNHHSIVSPDDDGPPENIHEWTFFVTPSPTDLIEEMHIFLDPTFDEDHIILRRPPYSITCVGWDTFTIEVRVFLKSGYSWVSENALDSPDGNVKCILPLEWALDFEEGSDVVRMFEVKRNTPTQRRPFRRESITAYEACP